MNGDFVTYEHLKTLIADMLLSQAQLQNLQIQSRFLLPNHYGINIWRLHDSIPYRMAKRPPAALSTNMQAPQFDDEKNTEESFEDVQAAPEPDDLPPSHRSTSRFLPAHTSLRWSSQELSLVDLDQAILHKKAYEAYLKSCSVLMIAARTFHAFKQKRLKMFECQ